MGQGQRTPPAAGRRWPRGTPLARGPLTVAARPSVPRSRPQGSETERAQFDSVNKLLYICPCVVDGPSLGQLAKQVGPRVRETCYFNKIEDEMLLSVRAVAGEGPAAAGRGAGARNPPLTTHPPPAPSQESEFSFAFPTRRDESAAAGAPNARCVMVLPLPRMAAVRKAAARLTSGL